MTVASTPRVGEVVHTGAAQLRAAGVEDARLESEVLLAHALGTGRARLLATLAEPLDAPTGKTFAALLSRRLEHEPLAYIVGHREFFGLDFVCASGALIPRPETEMLVDLALAEVRRRGGIVRLADVGTGSGAIAVAIAAHAPDVLVTAVDRSDAALRIASENAARNGVAGRIAFRHGDLLAAGGAFDVILANLPYVSEAEWTALPPEIRDHEPREALVGGETGTEIIERFMGSAAACAAPAGVIGAEIGATQGTAVLGMARRQFPEAESSIVRDLAGLDRMLVVRIKGG